MEKPDCVIVLKAKPVKNLPDVESVKATFKMGEGWEFEALSRPEEIRTVLWAHLVIKAEGEFVEHAQEFERERL